MIMFKKILNNLKKPHKIPFKIISKVKFYLKKKNITKIFTKIDKIKFLKQ